jgi:oligopeptide transport system substrate-binding protein
MTFVLKELDLPVPSFSKVDPSLFPFTRHFHCASLLQLIEKWKSRFPPFFDETIYNELAVLFNFAHTSYLDRHSVLHLFRLLFAIGRFRSKLFHHLSFYPYVRRGFIKLFPSHLTFPFSSKVVLGCLVGVTLKNSQEVLTVEDFQSLIDKSFPSYQLVPGMAYVHPTPHSSIKLLYFEIEKKSGELLTLHEKKQLYKALMDKLEGDLPRLIRPIFAPRNQEEVYKNILSLSREVQSTKDLPHLMISLDQQKDNELIFFMILVYVSSPRQIHLEKLFNQEDPTIKYVSEHISPVTFVENQFPVLAHTFRLHIQDHPRFHRSDGSLHFYEARKYISDLVCQAIGEFRDCNGGLILKLEEQLLSLKEYFSALFQKDPEIIETLFYSIVPLEKQATLSTRPLKQFFLHFLTALEFCPLQASDYHFAHTIESNHTTAAIRLAASPFQQTVRAAFEELSLKTALPLTWSILEIRGALSITLLIEQPYSASVEAYLKGLQDILERWSQQVKGHRVCRIALSPKAPSLDPRLGSDEHSSNLLKMLFEGLTRFNREGQIEGAIAESISVSPNGREYLFKLRPSFWNDGTPLTAHDFAYAWKKILSPEFSLSFAYFLYPIQNAQAIKEGLIGIDQLGVHVLNDHLLKVVLDYPVSYFLELVAHPIAFPVHRRVDAESPQWVNQTGSSYPCNGPFKLMTNHPTYGYQLVKNDLYWDRANFPLDQLVFLCMRSSEIQDLFQKGEIDMLGSPFEASVGVFVPEGLGEKYVSTDQVTSWCLFNTEKFPFNHAKVRQALSLVIHPSHFFSANYPYAEFSSSPIPPSLSLLPTTSLLEYDPVKAKRLLEEFLEEVHMKKEDFPLITISYALKRDNRAVTLYLKSVWENILGIRCKTEEESWDNLYHRYKRGDFQVGTLRWVSRFNDPAYTLNAFRYSSNVVNFSKWNNSLYQSFLDQAERALDEQAKKEYLKQAEQLLCQEKPIIPLIHSTYQCLKKNGIDSAFLARCGFYKLKHKRG